jgi:hypothetical protein
MKSLNTRDAMFALSLNQLSFWLLHEDMAAGKTSSWESIVHASQFGATTQPSTDQWVSQTIHRSQVTSQMQAARVAFNALPEDSKLIISLLHHDAPGRVPIELRVAAEWRPSAACTETLDLSLVICLLSGQTLEAMNRWCKNTPKRFKAAREEAKAKAMEALQAFSERYSEVVGTLSKGRKHRWVGDKK